VGTTIRETLMNPIWMADAKERPQFPALSGTVKADMVVVGGGITGLLVALRLCQTGKQVVLLEAERVAASNTGCSTGNLYATVSKGLAALRRKWSASQVREVVALRAAAMEWLVATAADIGVAGDALFRAPLVWCVAGYRDTSSPSVVDEAEACLEAGLDVRTKPLDLLVPSQHAFSLPNQAQCNPYVLGMALARAASAAGARIFEASRVINAEAKPGRVETPCGSVEAEHLVFATHTPPGFNLVQAQMEVYREWGIAAATSQSHPPGIHWIRDQQRSVRHHRLQGRDYLVVVGERHKTGAPIAGDYFDRLGEFAASFGADAAPAFRWSAQQYASADGLPYIGRSAHANVHLATGFGADGLTWGAVAAGIISELINGKASSAHRLLSPRRFTPGKSAAAWCRENATVFKHLTVAYLKRQRHDAADLPAGEGRIVRIDGKLRAAYRDAEGELVLLSCVCPHLKCRVAWNRLDRTWDCPCHGSRFRPTGEVIEGPALRGLERVD
jgi:glycine/D-amino acid oxidase-like deaminating enzyme/nitrite reductase/ring-hydroxylating ferredoxin subunit